MKKICLFLILLLIPSLVSANLAEFPQNFLVEDTIDAYIVVGEDGTATDVISQGSIGMKMGLYAGSPQTGINKIDNEVTLDNNLILIGNPCVNSLTDELLNNPSPCDDYYREGEAKINYIEENGNRYIIVAGNSAKGNKVAADHLANFATNGLIGTEIVLEVEGDEKKEYEKTEEKSTPLPLENVVAPPPIEVTKEEVVETGDIEEEKETLDEPDLPEEETKEGKIIIEQDKGFFQKIFEWFGSLFK